MSTLMPSIGVGLVGSLVVAMALAADWYIWKFRYWLSSASTVPPARDESVIHVSSASGRELVLSLAPEAAHGNMPAVQTVESECLSAREEG
jgi:hypothetical protein